MGHLLIVALLGCSPPETVEDACPGNFRGSGFATDGAEEAVLRASCYRKVVGFPPLTLSSSLQSAAAGHAAWMSTNDTYSDEEEAGTPGFIGATLEDRLTSAGWATPAFFWTQYDRDVDDDGAGLVDRWMSDPYRRESLLQPETIAVGFGLVGGYAHWITAFDFPTPTAGYVVYPRDGQQDVPTTWDSDGYSGDDVPDGDVGYPITITVGGPDANTDATGAYTSDPYGVAVENVVLAGPNGPVRTVIVSPSDPPDNATLLATIAVVPVDPLTPSSEWTFLADLTWTGGTASVTAVFQTGP